MTPFLLSVISKSRGAIGVNKEEEDEELPSGCNRGVTGVITVVAGLPHLFSALFLPLLLIIFWIICSL